MKWHPISSLLPFGKTVESLNPYNITIIMVGNLSIISAWWTDCPGWSSHAFNPCIQWNSLRTVLELFISDSNKLNRLLLWYFQISLQPLLYGIGGKHMLCLESTQENTPFIVNLHVSEMAIMVMFSLQKFSVLKLLLSSIYLLLTVSSQLGTLERLYLHSSFGTQIQIFCLLYLT